MMPVAIEYFPEDETIVLTDRLSTGGYGASSIEGKASPALGEYIMKLVVVAELAAAQPSYNRKALREALAALEERR